MSGVGVGYRREEIREQKTGNTPKQEQGYSQERI